jgi:hypothetical protein
MPDDDAVLKRLELYFEGRQANLAIFRATLQMTIMRREDILDELENTLQRAQDLARRENEPPLADLPALKDEPGVSISPAGPDADDPLHRSGVISESSSSHLPPSDTSSVAKPVRDRQDCSHS